jgi:hypothetical protein
MDRQHVFKPPPSSCLQSHPMVVIDAASSPPELKAGLRVKARGQCRAYADAGAVKAYRRDFWIR